MKKIIILSLLTFSWCFVISQNLYKNIIDTVYAVDFCVTNDTAYSINLKITRIPNDFVYEKTEIEIICSKKDIILNSKTISKQDTFLNPQQILPKENFLLLISTYEIQATLDKGIAIYKIDKQTLEINESKYFGLKDHIDFIRINSDYGTIKCIDLGNELIGLFSADTLTDRFSQTARTSIYPTLFKIDLLNNLIQTNELYNFLPAKSYGPIQINDSLFMFYVNDKEATKIVSFNKKLEILNVSNKFMFYDTFMTAPLDNYISYLKVDSNIYLTSTTDTLTRIGGFKFSSRMSITKLDLSGNILFRKGFKDGELIDNDTFNCRYLAAENTSLAYYNKKYYLVYFSNNSLSGIFKNNKLYLKVFDSNFNILTEKDFSVIDYEIRGVSIQFSRNSCYILSNIKNLYFNYKPYLIALDLDSLSTTISKNKISNNIISIFPNPAATKLTVNSETVIKEIYIYDLLGKLVKQINLENNKTKDTEIAIDELTAGIYFIQVVDEYDAKLSSKFIKE